MEVTFAEILKSIVDYGVLIVIGAIFLYTAVRLINIWLKRFDKPSNKEHDKLLDMRTTINTKVQAMINDFFESHSGNRVQVVEFSNSVTSIAYLPFKYMNCTYHVHKWGQDSSESYIDHLPTSLFTEFFARMYKEEYVILNKEDRDPALGGSIYDVLSRGSDKYALCAVIKTQRGKSIGYVAFKKDNEFSETDVADILVLADKLAALLGVLDK